MADVVQYSSSGKELYPPNAVRPKFVYHSGVLVITALADAATDGYYWILNPVANTKNIAIRRVVCRASTTTALVCLTAPRITIERMTFTGVCSATALVPAKVETSEATATALVVAATTSATPTAGAPITGFIIPAIMTAVGAGVVVVDQSFIPNVSEEIIIAPGEGIVVRQADAGTTSDTRICIVDIVWEEYLK